jgi:hypothetical protein
MAGNTHTPRVSIPWTNVTTGGVDRDTITFTQDSLTLLFGLSIDTALWNEPSYWFQASTQITEVATGQRFNNYWRAPLNALPQAGSLWISNSWAQAQWAGVRTAQIAYFNQSGDGLYLYRPSFTLLSPGVVDPEFFIPTGKSEFAVGEEHFIFCEMMY